MPKILKDRGWSNDWKNLGINWDKVFLLTATEPAKGRHLGVRAIQAGTVTAVMAAMPFVIYAVWPAFPVLKLSWPNLFSWGHLKKIGGSIFGNEVQSIQSRVYDDASHKIVDRVASNP